METDRHKIEERTPGYLYRAPTLLPPSHSSLFEFWSFGPPLLPPTCSNAHHWSTQQPLRSLIEHSTTITLITGTPSNCHLHHWCTQRSLWSLLEHSATVKECRRCKWTFLWENDHTTSMKMRSCDEKCQIWSDWCQISQETRKFKILVLVSHKTPIHAQSVTWLRHSATIKKH